MSYAFPLITAQRHGMLELGKTTERFCSSIFQSLLYGAPVLWDAIQCNVVGWKICGHIIGSHSFSENLIPTLVGSVGDTNNGRVWYLFPCFLVAIVATGCLQPSSEGYSSLSVYSIHLLPIANFSGIYFWELWGLLPSHV